MPEGVQRQLCVGHGAMRDRILDQPGCQRRLAQRERRKRLTRHQRPRIEQGRQVDHVVVEWIRNFAAAEPPFQKLDIHPNVLSRGDHKSAFGQHVAEFGQNLAQLRRALPISLVVAADRGSFWADPFGSGQNLPLGPRQFDQPVIGQDHSDFGDVVELRIEPSELAVHERDDPLGPAGAAPGPTRFGRGRLS